jgi:hypothetical protein
MLCSVGGDLGEFNRGPPSLRLAVGVIFRSLNGDRGMIGVLAGVLTGVFNGLLIEDLGVPGHFV